MPTTCRQQEMNFDHSCMCKWHPKLNSLHVMMDSALVLSSWNVSFYVYNRCQMSTFAQRFGTSKYLLPSLRSWQWNWVVIKSASSGSVITALTKLTDCNPTDKQHANNSCTWARCSVIRRCTCDYRHMRIETYMCTRHARADAVRGSETNTYCQCRSSVCHIVLHR